MASKVFLPFLLMTFFSHSLNCEPICLDVKPQNTTDCDFPVTPLTHDELFVVRNVYLENFCRDYVNFRSLIIHRERGVSLYDTEFMYDHSCSKFFNSISGLLYWSPGETSAKYLDKFYKDYQQLIFKKESIDTGLEEIQMGQVYKLSSDISANVGRMSLLVMSEPTSYTIEVAEMHDERKRRVEIVDLGTFSMFNPSGDFQEINVHLNLTDDLIMRLDDYYLYERTEILLKENDNVWKGKSVGSLENTLKRTHLAKLTISSPLPPRTSVSGRIFATVTLTSSPFTATMRINGGNSTENLAGNISGELLKYEKLKLRVENLKMSSRQNTIIFASYIACLVGLISALIIGCAIFLICLVAQKKDKECICPQLNLNVDCAKKRAFIAEKSRKMGEVFAQVGNICASICNCVYKEVV